MSDVSGASLDAAQNQILATSTTYYLSLHTGDPGQTGASEGADGREAITFNASSGGTQVSADGQTWPSTAGGQTYPYFGVWSAASSGTYLRGGALASPITPPPGAQVVFAAGGISFTAS